MCVLIWVSYKITHNQASSKSQRERSKDILPKKSVP